jgi:hypothetical protein
MEVVNHDSPVALARHCVLCRIAGEQMQLLVHTHPIPRPGNLNAGRVIDLRRAVSQLGDVHFEIGKLRSTEVESSRSGVGLQSACVSGHACWFCAQLWLLVL